MIAIFHLITSTTPPKLMAIRFMLQELMWLIGIISKILLKLLLKMLDTFKIINPDIVLIFYIALPISQSLGGYLLVQTPLFHTGEIRNFTLVFIVDLVLQVMGVLWVVFMLREKAVRKLELKVEVLLQQNEGTGVELKTDISREDRDIHPLRLLFDLENIKSMFRTVFKRRANRVRLQLSLVTLSILIFMMFVQGNLNQIHKF